MRTTSTTYELADGMIVTVCMDTEEHRAIVSASREANDFLKCPAEDIERVAKLLSDLRSVGSYSAEKVCADHGYFNEKSDSGYRCPACLAEEKAQERLEEEAKANASA